MEYCKISEVGGFSVFIFLGDVPPNPSQWLNDPAFAGVFDVYDSAPRDLANLNSAVLGRSRQGSLEPEAIVPFLKQDLNWAVQTLAVITFLVI